MHPLLIIHIGLLQVLCRALEQEQSSLPTTADEDKKAMELKQQRGAAETLALQFRIEKKAVLAAALQAARQRRNQLEKIHS